MTKRTAKRKAAFTSNKLGGTWFVTTNFMNDNGIIKLVDLSIEPKANKDESVPELTPEVLKALPLEKIINDQLNPDFDSPTRSIYDDLRVRPPKRELKKLAERYLAEREATNDETPKRGRPFSYDADSLVDVALAYWEGGSTPIQTVAEKCDLPYSTAAKKVTHARNAGMIPGSRKVTAIQTYLR